MKTRNEKTGNSNNQLSRVLLNAAAVLVSVVLLSFTVSAQGLFKELLSYSSYGKMALVLVDESNAIENNELASLVSNAAFTINEETEEPLLVENWMTNEEYFGSANIFNQAEQEETLEVEYWMTNDSYFNSSNTYNQVEMETPLEFESWMTNEEYFGSASNFKHLAQEEILEIESWMTNENFYKGRFTEEQEEELLVEAWMCDASYYNK